MTRIKAYMCPCRWCKRDNKWRHFIVNNFNRNFRHKSKSLLKLWIDELPTVSYERYTD